MIRPVYCEFHQKWLIQKGNKTPLYFTGFRLWECWQKYSGSPEYGRAVWSRTKQAGVMFDRESDAECVMVNQGVGVRLPNPDNC